MSGELVEKPVLQVLVSTLYVSALGCSVYISLVTSVYLPTYHIGLDIECFYYILLQIYIFIQQQMEAMPFFFNHANILKLI